MTHAIATEYTSDVNEWGYVDDGNDWDQDPYYDEPINLRHYEAYTPAVCAEGTTLEHADPFRFYEHVWHLNRKQIPGMVRVGGKWHDLHEWLHESRSMHQHNMDAAIADLDCPF